MNDKKEYTLPLAVFYAIGLILLPFDDKSIFGLISGIMFSMIAIWAIFLIFKKGEK